MTTKGAGNDLGGARKISPITINPNSRPPRYIWNQLQNGCHWRWVHDLDNLTKQKGTVNSLTACQLSLRASSCNLTEVQMGFVTKCIWFTALGDFSETWQCIMNIFILVDLGASETSPTNKRCWSRVLQGCAVYCNRKRSVYITFLKRCYSLLNWIKWI